MLAIMFSLMSLRKNKKKNIPIKMIAIFIISIQGRFEFALDTVKTHDLG